MATRAELLGNIELLVTGGRPTDESRYWDGQALFLLNYETARAVYEDAVERMKANRKNSGLSWGAHAMQKIDPSLLQQATLDVVAQQNDRGEDAWGEAKIPEPPLPMPDNFGIIDVYVRNKKTGVPILLKPGTIGTARPVTSVLFSRPIWTHVGDKLQVYGFKGNPIPDTITVNMVGFGEIPEGMTEEEFMNQTYPLPEHLITIVTQRVVGQLREQLGMPGDSFNDNKDQSTNPQPS